MLKRGRREKMLIKKKYERLINTGKFENVKIGIEIEKEFENLSLKEDVKIKKIGLIMGGLAQSIVEEEAAKVESENKKED